MKVCEESVRTRTPKPHVYATVERVYTRAISGEGSQSLIISGESGAGKTESAKVALSYFVWRTRHAQSEAEQIEARRRGCGRQIR